MKAVILNNWFVNITDKEFNDLKKLEKETFCLDLDDHENADVFTKYNDYIFNLRTKYILKAKKAEEIFLQKY